MQKWKRTRNTQPQLAYRYRLAFQPDSYQPLCVVDMPVHETVHIGLYYTPVVGSIEKIQLLVEQIKRKPILGERFIKIHY